MAKMKLTVVIEVADALHCGDDCYYYVPGCCQLEWQERLDVNVGGKPMRSSFCKQNARGIEVLEGK